jgi:hypothetical protein
MTFPPLRCCVLFILSVVTVLFGASLSLAGLPADSWWSVELPFRAMGLSAAGDSIWVCGADEMIAVSRDGGKSWSVKHRKEDGEILLTIVLVDSKFGYAAGTNGSLLGSSDSGETWTTVSDGSETILELSFSDPIHGIRRTRTHVETTDDSGKHRTPVSVLKSNPAIAPFDNLLSVASLDANHAAIALHQTQGENIFVLTSDGGKTWNSLHLDNTFAGQLCIHRGEYWAFGIEYLEREKSGGYSAPVSLHSADGKKWTHGAKSPAEFNSCTAQGCILYDGAIADLYGDQPHYLSVPADGSLEPVWAFANHSICTVGPQVKCALANWVPGVPPRPTQTSGPHTSGVGIPLAYETDLNQISRCLSCPLGSFSVSKNVQGMGTLEVRFTINKDGSVRDVKLKNAPSKDIESGTQSILKDWFFEPARDSKGHSETELTFKLDVLCMRHPDDDSGTCHVIRPSYRRAN